MKYELNKKIINVKIIKKNNKNTYLRYKNNTIIITTNKVTTNSEIIKLLKNYEKKITKMIEKIDEKEKNQQFFYYLGHQYELINVPTPKISFHNRTITYTNHDQINNFLSVKIKSIFQQRLKHNYKKISNQKPYPNLIIKKLKSKWGMYNKKNNTITLNANLIRYDLKCLDYVIIHELCHQYYFDHSKNFWNLVKTYEPNYKQIKQLLDK